MITIIDYGLGNVLAFAHVYKRLNIPFSVAKSKADFSETTKLILPGVGAFDHAMRQLDHSDMRKTLDDMVVQQGIPILGVCIGMQMLAHCSEEGRDPGLGWIDGQVKKMNVPSLPHMGWNDVSPIPGSPLFAGLERDASFYFLHSYYFECNDRGHSVAESNYGATFSCAVNYRNIYGVQFHPEKSHHFGVQLLKNFSDL
jgi:glutamine amidotransferase